MSVSAATRALTPPDIARRKGGSPIVCLTAYTTPVARLVDRHCDLVLVGDSVGMVHHGLASTLGATLDMMILHGQAVRRGLERALMVVDMPFGSYEGGPEPAFRNAARIMAETGCGAVKLEGGETMAETIRFLVARGIPVMAHVGLTPQSVNTLGGYKVQGRGPDAERVLRDAVAVADAGAFSIVLEQVTEAVARTITETVAVPTIGIGASAACDGQVLVVDDMLGLFTDFRPRFVKRYADLGHRAEAAIAAYAQEVRERRFPAAEHVFGQDGRKGGDPAVPIVRTVAELRSVVAGWRREGAKVAVVPTMGALHEGHLSLVRAALERADHRVIVTLFINPRQFGSAADLAAYPRTEREDAAKLGPVGAHLLYAPDGPEIYPDGFDTTVSTGTGGGLCAVHRPGHFEGVATVVAKLFLQTAADVAFFGEKDFQQLHVVRRMARDLDIPIEVVGCPTVRDPDGLALSSRNVRLSEQERRQAPRLAAILSDAARALASGAMAGPVLADAKTAIAASGYHDVEYLELRAEDDLRPLDRADRPARLLVAAWLGGTRMIDNVPVAAATG